MAESQLDRGVGRWATVALMLNGIIGAGIFGLPSKVHALAGPWGLLAYAACAVVVACIALCFAEVASRFTGTGGPYLYARTAFGPLPGFLVGWLMWLTRVAALAAISSVMASYLGYFWPPAGGGAGRAIAIAAAITALTAINLVGVRRAAGAAGVLTIAKLLPLLLFVAVGLFHVDAHTFAGARMPAAAPFAQAVLQLVFAFGGFEACVVAAGETRDPRRDLPFALLVAIAGAAALYVGIQVVCIGTLPGLAGSEKPLADASVRFAGAAGGAILTLGALLSTLGTLCGSLLLGPRILFAMAEQGQLPRGLALTNLRFRTPHVAILVTAVFALALALSGGFTYLLGLSVIARLATYLATAVALPVLRRSGSVGAASFRLPAAGIVVTVTIAACLWLLSKSGLRELRDVGIAVAAGLALHAVDRGRRRGAIAGTAAAD